MNDQMVAVPEHFASTLRKVRKIHVVTFYETPPSSFQLTRGKGCAGDAILFFRFLKMSSHSEVTPLCQPYSLLTYFPDA